MSDGFLSRWARRKRDVRLSERAEIPPVAEDFVDHPPTPADETVASDAAAEAERDLLADLPSLADLTAETDLTPFLRAGVPSAMRNAALRKMWSVDPAIRDFVSEAREYAYDWNTPGGVPGLGPLLPVDDVKAMLGRLFNRDPSEPLAADTSRVNRHRRPMPKARLSRALLPKGSRSPRRRTRRSSWQNRWIVPLLRIPRNQHAQHRSIQFQYRACDAMAVLGQAELWNRDCASLERFLS